MNKLGVTYNLWDGEELLEQSIDCIRDNVDYISVIYQEISNFGERNSVEVRDLLLDLKKSGKIDDVFLYTPMLNTNPHVNEHRKRTLGYESCKNNKCDVFMFMDSDEFYLKDEFIKAKERFKEENKDISCCKLYTYYKTNEYILDPIEEYLVGLFYRIKENQQIPLGGNFPYYIDPCRRITGDTWFDYPQDEIMMHHYSYVRKDIRKKFRNSSARQNFDKFIDEAVDYINNWEYPNKAMMIGMDKTFHDVKKVDFWKK